MKLALAVLALLAPGVGSAAPALPAKLPLADAAHQKARAAEFRKRNPQRWDDVLVDHHGFIKRVVTHDAKLAAATPDQLEAFLRANADLFGIDPDDAKHAHDGHTWDAPQLGAVVLGQIAIDRPKGELVIYAMSHFEATPTLTEADLAKRLAGKRYTETIGYARPPMRDCAMTPLGAAGCKMRVEQTRKREIALSARDLRTATALYQDGDTFRLIGCVDASQLANPPADPSWEPLVPSTHAYAAIANAPPLPYFVDLVTGDVLRIPNAHECYSPVFSDPR
ncbi:MAG TPA: hypothetical protein VIV58_27895 [Kofleriaceae bacterium]